MRRALSAAGLGWLICVGGLQAQGVGSEITQPGEWDTDMMAAGSAPSSLAGLNQLWVTIGPMGLPNENRNLTPEVADELSAYVQLELRKAGIRMATNPRIVTDSGGHLEITLTERPRMFGSDWRVRFEVQQVASLARDSSQIALLPTWSHEELLEGATVDSLRAIFHKSTDLFLSDWLTANGR